ncbi:hypothetical protein COCON_G00074220 [Conger conger]|uniref:Uncharacterized protein n=1 Tax=Conger conger TaxID=82655 RepID=A0A9Q1DN96_CONCO|nr:hypothetical protein COCON_G00074220 [Conger conger]
MELPPLTAVARRRLRVWRRDDSRRQPRPFRAPTVTPAVRNEPAALTHFCCRVIRGGRLRGLRSTCSCPVLDDQRLGVKRDVKRKGVLSVYLTEG